MLTENLVPLGGTGSEQCNCVGTLCPGDPMSDKKGKAKSQNLPRRQRKGAPARKSKASMPGKSRGRSRGAVVAVSTTRTNPTQFSEGPVFHKVGGRGQRFVGAQMLTSVVTTASDSQMWTGTSPAATYSINQILLSPDNLNGRLAVFANVYARFVFRRIMIEYEPLVATSQAGGGVLAIVNDPQISIGTTILTYALAQDVTPSVTFPFRERAKLEYTYSGDDLFYTENDTEGHSSLRLTNQGVLIGIPSASSLGALTMGTLRIHYVIDMFQPVPTSAISASERKLVREFLAKVRGQAQPSEGKEERKASDPVPVSRQVASGSTSSTSVGVSASSQSQNLLRAVDDNYVLVKRA